MSCETCRHAEMCRWVDEVGARGCDFEEQAQADGKYQTDKDCYNCGQPRDYKGRCIPYKEGNCNKYSEWIPKQMERGSEHMTVILSSYQIEKCKEKMCDEYCRMPRELDTDLDEECAKCPLNLLSEENDEV